MQGALGPQGAKGDSGAQGPKGEVGPQGAKGDAGAQGSGGIQGVKGDAGAAGAKGDMGPMGIQGMAGTQIGEGAEVPDRFSGAVGDFYLQTGSGDYYVKIDPESWILEGNLRGPQGAQGVQGVKGDAGAQGPQGVKGDAGPQGIQGPQGDQGIQGPAGTITAPSGTGFYHATAGVGDAAAKLADKADLSAALQALLVPAGVTMDWGGASASIPAGWLFCDGRSLLRGDYPALFAAVGTTHGAVDGTHFNLPTRATARSMGAATAYAAGAKADPVHIHTGHAATGGAVGAESGHTHASGGLTGQEDADHVHVTAGHTLLLAEIPSHRHGFTVAFERADGSGTTNSHRGSAAGRQWGTAETSPVDFAGSGVIARPRQHRRHQRRPSPHIAGLGASTGQHSRIQPAISDGSAATAIPPYLAMPKIIKT